MFWFSRWTPARASSSAPSAPGVSGSNISSVAGKSSPAPELHPGFVAGFPLDLFIPRGRFDVIRRTALSRLRRLEQRSVRLNVRSRWCSRRRACVRFVVCRHLAVRHAHLRRGPARLTTAMPYDPRAQTRRSSPPSARLQRIQAAASRPEGENCGIHETAISSCRHHRDAPPAGYPRSAGKPLKIVLSTEINALYQRFSKLQPSPCITVQPHAPHDFENLISGGTGSSASPVMHGLADPRVAALAARWSAGTTAPRMSGGAAVTKALRTPRYRIP